MEHPTEKRRRLSETRKRARRRAAEGRAARKAFEKTWASDYRYRKIDEDGYFIQNPDGTYVYDEGTPPARRAAKQRD